MRGRTFLAVLLALLILTHGNFAFAEEVAQPAGSNMYMDLGAEEQGAGTALQKRDPAQMTEEELHELEEMRREMNALNLTVKRYRKDRKDIKSAQAAKSAQEAVKVTQGLM